jgi:uncharacterized protein (TIGR02996 family)
MTHADAFLHDILAHPDDDAPRLIFADWLEEQGDAKSVARAEFIRIQCALAAGNLPQQRRAELYGRQRHIVDTWGKEWVRPIRRLVQSWEFHRGFIDDVTMWAHTFLDRAGQLFCRAPIRYVSLRTRMYRQSYPDIHAPLNVAALADNKYLRRLRGLDLRQNQLESHHVRALVVSEHLANLTELGLSYDCIGDSGIRALAGWPLLSQLEYLNLRGNDIGANGVRVLTHTLEKLAGSPTLMAAADSGRDGRARFVRCYARARTRHSAGDGPFRRLWPRIVGSACTGN